MARSGIAAMRVPPLVPLPSSSNSNGGGFSDSFTTSASRFSSNVKNRVCCFVACTFVVPRSRGGISKFSGFGKYLRHLRQQQQLSRATVSDESSSDSTSAQICYMVLLEMLCLEALKAWIPTYEDGGF
ncbi:unnamed protein product [Sphagnum jensenii]|uniref:Uncharacterized protein n=1 Tax=Sphagnum jensenii TaxID=128206 RepID=A0ABP1A0Q9_9BRYO